MNTKQIIELVLKLFGVYLLILFFDNLSGILESLSWFIDSSAGDKQTGIIILLSKLFRTIIYSLGSWYFILKPNSIIEKFNIENVEILQLKNSELQITMFQISGIIILFFSIDSILSVLLLIGMSSFETLGYNNYKYYLFYFIPPTLKVILGFGLLFYPKLISKVISKKQNRKFGNKQSAPADS
jgi:hypothetical protein